MNSLLILIFLTLSLQGADKNISERHNKNTPFHAAAQNGHLSVVQYFLQQGEDIEAANEMGATALMIAVQKGH